MQMIVEAYLVDDEKRTASVRSAVMERELTTDPLGLSLAQRKGLLASAQEYLVRGQCQCIAAAYAHCEKCDAVPSKNPADLVDAAGLPDRYTNPVWQPAFSRFST